MKQPEVENIKAAYDVADENGKKMLRALYPDLFTKVRAKINRPVMERVKTFDDACHELGEAHPLVQDLNRFEHSMAEEPSSMPDVLAYLKLRIVAAALNEGWIPDWNNKDQLKWYPWFYLYSEEEFNAISDKDNYRAISSAGAGVASTSSGTIHGSRLAFKSKKLATYCGEQFGELWVIFHIG